MKVKVTVFLVAAVFILCCNAKRPNHTEETLSEIDSLAPKSIRPNSTTVDNEVAYSGCIRGQAQPVIKKEIYPKSDFKLNQDNRTAIETVELLTGDKLIINNWGCEYFVLTFRFETERFAADTTNVKYWLERVVLLMNEIEGGLLSPLDVKGGTTAIRTYLTNTNEYKLGEEIIYNGDIIRDLVTLDRIQRISDRRFAIELSFSKGPL